MRPAPRPEHIEVVDDAIADILRRKSPSERLNMAFAANRTARMILTSAIREQHPLWDTDAVAREVARRMLEAAESSGPVALALQIPAPSGRQQWHS